MLYPLLRASCVPKTTEVLRSSLAVLALATKSQKKIYKTGKSYVGFRITSVGVGVGGVGGVGGGGSRSGGEGDSLHPAGEDAPARRSSGVLQVDPGPHEGRAAPAAAPAWRPRQEDQGEDLRAGPGADPGHWPAHQASRAGRRAIRGPAAPDGQARQEGA